MPPLGVEAEIEAHPDNADALAFGSSIMGRSGPAGAGRGLGGPRHHAGCSTTTLFSTTSPLTNALLGKIDAALDRLERAFFTSPTFRRRLAAWLKHDREMHGLRDHPRFRSPSMDDLEAGAIAAAAPARATERDGYAQPKPSIAVFPFLNLSDDPEQRYFSDGITEDIITELSRFRTLFVIARNSSSSIAAATSASRASAANSPSATWSRAACAVSATACGSPPSSSRRRAAITCGPTATTAMPSTC